jgi:hypothetical protein
MGGRPEEANEKLASAFNILPYMDINNYPARLHSLYGDKVGKETAKAVGNAWVKSENSWIKIYNQNNPDKKILKARYALRRYLRE